MGGGPVSRRWWASDTSAWWPGLAVGGLFRSFMVGAFSALGRWAVRFIAWLMVSPALLAREGRDGGESAA